MNENQFLNSFLEILSAEARSFGESFAQHISIIAPQKEESSDDNSITRAKSPTVTHSILPSIQSRTSKSSNHPPPIPQDIGSPVRRKKIIASMKPPRIPTPTTQHDIPSRGPSPKESSSNLPSPSHKPASTTDSSLSPVPRPDSPTYSPFASLQKPQSPTNSRSFATQKPQSPTASETRRTQLASAQSQDPSSPKPLGQSPSRFSPSHSRQSSSQVSLPIPPNFVNRAAEVRPTDEIRAYEYYGPVELPTRKPTHKKEQSITSIKVDEGLHIAETASDFEKSKGSPQSGLRPLSPSAEDSRSISNFSSVGSISGKPFKGLLGRFGGSKKPSLIPLPAGLEFCFSNCAQHIIFWCKRNPDSIIRLRHPFESAQRCEMLVPAPLVPAPNRSQARSIRLLAASTDVAVAIVHIEEVGSCRRSCSHVLKVCNPV